MIYLTLYWEFFKTGLFALGGGLATIPFLSAMIDRYGWFTYSELTNMIAISESTPGPIGINMATYVGFTVKGVLGAITATIGEVTPSIIIIIIVAKILQKFKENKYIKNAFLGIRPTVVGLISSAVVGLIFSSVIFIDNYKATGNLLSVFDLRILLIFISVYLLNLKFKIHPAFYLILSAIAGIIFGL